MSTHDGHRQRMKNAFAEHGLESFDDVHALEFLLFYVRARCNTNEIAHELLDRFGSLDAVFEARWRNSRMSMAWAGRRPSSCALYRRSAGAI